MRSILTCIAVLFSSLSLHSAETEILVEQIPGWKPAYFNENSKGAILEWVKENDAIEHWQELITISIIESANNAGAFARGITGLIKLQKANTSIHLHHTSPEWAEYSWHIPNDEVEIGRVFSFNGAIVLFRYTTRVNEDLKLYRSKALKERFKNYFNKLVTTVFKNQRHVFDHNLNLAYALPAKYPFKFSKKTNWLGNTYAYTLMVNRFPSPEKATAYFNKQYAFSKNLATQNQKTKGSVISVAKADNNPPLPAYNIVYHDEGHQSVGRVLCSKNVLFEVLVRSSYKWNYQVNNFAKRLLDSAIDYHETE